MTRRTRRRFLSPTLCLLVVAVTVTVGATGAPAAPQATKTLNFRLAAAPPNLDPATYGQEDNPLQMMRFFYDSLVVNQDGTIKPYLATKWQQLGARRMKFWLRTDVKCADGTRLLASDVAKTVRYFSDPATKSRANTFIFNQPSAAAKWDNYRGTVTITYPKANPDAVYAIARMPVICNAGTSNPVALQTQTFGSGPFVLTESVPGDHYTLTKRKGYTWGPNGDTTGAVGFPDRVVLRVIENETTAANAFLAGQLDVMFARGLERDRLQSSSTPSFKLVLPAQVNLMMINQQADHAGADLNVRKGLVASMGRANLTRVILGASGRLANALLLPDSPCQDTAKPALSTLLPQFNATAARNYFLAAGYTLVGGKLMKDGKQLSLKLQIIDGYAPAADYLVTLWGQQGINVSAVIAPASQVIGTITGSTNWDIAFATFSTHYPSYLHSFLQGPPRPTGFNFMYVNNPEYVALSTKALTQVETTKACNDWRAAYRAVQRQLNMVPLAYADTNWYGRKVTFKGTAAMFGIFPSSLRVGK